MPVGYYPWEDREGCLWGLVLRVSPTEVMIRDLGLLGEFEETTTYAAEDIHGFDFDKVYAQRLLFLSHQRLTETEKKEIPKGEEMDRALNFAKDYNVVLRIELPDQGSRACLIESVQDDWVEIQPLDDLGRHSTDDGTEFVRIKDITVFEQTTDEQLLHFYFHESMPLYDFCENRAIWEGLICGTSTYPDPKESYLSYVKHSGREETWMYQHFSFHMHPPMDFSERYEEIGIQTQINWRKLLPEKLSKEFPGTPIVIETVWGSFTTFYQRTVGSPQLEGEWRVVDWRFKVPKEDAQDLPEGLISRELLSCGRCEEHDWAEPHEKEDAPGVKWITCKACLSNAMYAVKPDRQLIGGNGFFEPPKLTG